MLNSKNATFSRLKYENTRRLYCNISGSRNDKLIFFLHGSFIYVKYNELVKTRNEHYKFYNIIIIFELLIFFSSFSESPSPAAALIVYRCFGECFYLTAKLFFNNFFFGCGVCGSFWAPISTPMFRKCAETVMPKRNWTKSTSGLFNQANRALLDGLLSVGVYEVNIKPLDLFFSGIEAHWAP